MGNNCENDTINSMNNEEEKLAEPLSKKSENDSAFCNIGAVKDISRPSIRGRVFDTVTVSHHLDLFPMEDTRTYPVRGSLDLTAYIPLGVSAKPYG